MIEPLGYLYGWKNDHGHLAGVGNGSYNVKPLSREDAEDACLDTSPVIVPVALIAVEALDAQASEAEMVERLAIYLFDHRHFNGEGSFDPDSTQWDDPEPAMWEEWRENWRVKARPLVRAMLGLEQKTKTDHA